MPEWVIATDHDQGQWSMVNGHTHGHTHHIGRWSTVSAAASGSARALAARSRQSIAN